MGHRYDQCILFSHWDQVLYRHNRYQQASALYVKVLHCLHGSHINGSIWQLADLITCLVQLLNQLFFISSRHMRIL